MMCDQLRKGIFSVSEKSFNSLSLEIFQYQFSNNVVYREYCSLLGKNANDIRDISHIPFLPIEFFKTHRIVTGNFSPQKIIVSSGTTGEKTSRHFVSDLKLYEESFLRAFKLF